MQFVEIARALAGGIDRLLILDEPTAALTPTETERLFRIVRRLRDRGIGIVFISHRLEEIEGLVDTVTVLRDGRHVATAPASEMNEQKVVQLMVGRSLGDLYPGEEDQGARAGGRATTARLRIESLGLTGVFEDVSFTVGAGEIVGMAGLVGAGRSAVAQAIFGITPPSAGRVLIDGVPVQPTSPQAMLRHGLAFVPEDRDGEGLATALAIRTNLVLPIVDRLARAGFLRFARERATSEELVRDLQIRAASIEQPVAALSGGNRQKVVLGKWLATGPRILILDEPTHGIDVGTKAQVHGIIRRLAAEGLAILLISSDLPEVLRISDRILVMADGRLTAELAAAEATPEAVIRAATLRRRELAA